jgi:hypothetical protein
MNSLAQRPLARFVILAVVGLVVAAVSSASLEAAGWNHGIVTVIEAAGAFKVLAKTELGEQIYATPAAVDKQLYLRTTQHLWAFGE